MLLFLLYPDWQSLPEELQQQDAEAERLRRLRAQDDEWFTIYIATNRKPA